MRLLSPILSRAHPPANCMHTLQAPAEVLELAGGQKSLLATALLPPPPHLKRL